MKSLSLSNLLYRVEQACCRYRLAHDPFYKTYTMDCIEDVKVDADERGNYLIIEGDFTRTCEAYLADDDKNTMRFCLDDIYELLKQTRYWVGG